MRQTSIALLAAVCLVPLASGGCSKGNSSSAAGIVDAASAKPSAAAALPPIPGALPAPPDLTEPPADATKEASGLITKVLTPGTGTDHPQQTDKVKVHYSGWTQDGRMFDSSVVRGQPATFGLGMVIPGWTEALKLMVAGEKRRLWIPGNLAYGDKPTRPGAPSGELVFDVELLDIIPAPKPPPVPEDVKAAPANAKKTPSGLAFRVLTPGTGTVHPDVSSNVTVNYTGWTTDGNMFDSSITRGQPARFSLGSVIKGWTEGVQLMTKGEKARFWIPGNLAYGDKPARPGAPAGTLVFDIELVDFVPGRPPMPPPGAPQAAASPAASAK